MITHLGLYDFQSIPSASLELGAWTTLVGESDVGKSAVLRSLWCMFTNARGDWFIRHGSGHCVVELTLDSGTHVSWTKMRGRGGVYTVVADSFAQDYTPAPGQGMPPEVRALLPVAIEVAGEEMMPGFQQQQDRPFLFADTARHRAQVLGEFDGTNLLLAADGALRTQRTSFTQAVALRREEGRAAAAEVEAHQWVEGAAELAVVAQGAIERATVAEGRVNALTGFLEAVEANAAELAVLEAKLDPLHVTAAGLALEFAAQHMHRAGLIADTGSQARKVALEMTALAKHPPTDLDPWHLRLDRLDSGVATLLRIDLAGRTLEQAELELTHTSRSLAEARQHLRALIGEPCPTCGERLTEDELLA